jgi:pimeloyl-ACP methyl ester carboxylesterase
VVPDLPGFGKSGALPQPDLEGLAQAVAQLLDALAIERVAVIAYSFGSLVGLTLAMRRPDLVDRLMVINPPGWRERSPEMVDLQIKAAIRSKEAGLRAGIEFTLREIMLQNHALLDEACLDQSEFAVRHLRMISKDISRSVDLIAMLESISAPWHVVFSANDPYHRYKLEERRGKLAAVCGHECTTVIRDARHWVQQDQADVFNALVAAFVVGTTPATSLPSEV